MLFRSPGLGAVAGEGHVHPDDVVPGVGGARGGDGGVDSAGQRREHAHGVSFDRIRSEAGQGRRQTIAVWSGRGEA